MYEVNRWAFRMDIFEIWKFASDLLSVESSPDFFGLGNELSKLRSWA